MTLQEIKDYRKILEKEFIDKDNEIENQLSYITVAAIGFFITINEKFLKIQSADYKFVLILSLIFLFVTFVLILLRKSRTSYHDLKMIEFIDNMTANSNDQDQELLIMWEKSHKQLRNIRIFIYSTLSIGIGLQVLFIILNYKSLT